MAEGVQAGWPTVGGCVREEGLLVVEVPSEEELEEEWESGVWSWDDLNLYIDMSQSTSSFLFT